LFSRLARLDGESHTMHGFEDTTKPAPQDAADNRPWYKMLNRYHWFVLMVAALGWLFDCLDQQLFILARPQAMRDLVPEVAPDPEHPQTTQELKKQTDNERLKFGHIATSIFIAGWACGGLLFGMLGDRIGRAKVMLMTILLYSLFTGLSSFSQGFWDFALYRFLTGLGVGGEFAVGVALVAEVMPSKARPYTLGLLQSLSAIGNISAAFINLGLGIAAEQGMEYSPWRVMFLIGALPALLAVFIRTRLKEPEQWEKASHDDAVKKQLGSYRELFANPTFRKHAILGLILGCSGIIGLWCVGFYTPDLTQLIQKKQVMRDVYTEQIAEARGAGKETHAAALVQLHALEEKQEKIPENLKPTHEEVSRIITGRLSRWSSYTSMMQNLGAAFGMFGFGALAQRIGRKPTFVIAFLAAFVSTMAVFWTLNEFWQIFVLVPIMGFCQLSLFAGYAIYFPELFPTRLRSTGTSFCYNVGRFIAALGPLMKVFLDSVFQHTTSDPTMQSRYTGMAMCSVFLVGLFVLPFLPETRGKPLPE
jgi:MFS family permease